MVIFSEKEKKNVYGDLELYSGKDGVETQPRMSHLKKEEGDYSLLLMTPTIIVTSIYCLSTMDPRQYLAFAHIII